MLYDKTMKAKFFCLISVFLIVTNVKSADFIDKGYYVIDLVNKIEWRKCTVGQLWDEEKKRCLGSPIKLNMEEIKEANLQINEQLDGEWRLPTRKELESIVCADCEGSKIDKIFFPDTPAEPFWTSQRNWWSPKFFWSVNFFTGHAFGRFVPEKRLFIRFVRER